MRGPSLVRSRIEACRDCPRLVAWREQVAREKRAKYKHETYWGRPVAGFGDARGRIVIVGLAPGAHGANRTGRIFTGDRSGDFLYAALHRAGLANQPTSVSRDDGLTLTDAFITCAARCAPPDNRPLPSELSACEKWLDLEAEYLHNARVFLALGSIAWEASVALLARRGAAVGKPKPKFSHGAELAVGSVTLLGSYHVSQQNTQTGRLTPAMFDAVLARVKQLAHGPARTAPKTRHGARPLP